ncbi:hypothetical protein CBLAS_1547 [Campylobacter blaseri]|uniref:Uncharacterized protein n=1 Tax=Campylobacter blaseri TaxID=2042961 RepID=A0A2P8QZD8_9BACT|nr:hypothetical protein [Campylobacter blaseri]PSM51618.1 hypothetical protein CQ405_07430 [Campylobacter blaseri]PSM53411.1 hypothetical protein CRN67_07435 [Campylobacter blaseri]QKF86708.1 hypothetical protein CBLAS_1547 [Campylobacter blaseri]
MKNSEYILKNESLKNSEVTFSGNSILKDVIKEYAYKHYNGDCLKFDFLGKIDVDFRAVLCIYKTKNDEDSFLDINLDEYDLKFGFSIFDIVNEFSNLEHCLFIKLNQDEILHQVLLYISYERFEGGYFAKGKFMGSNFKNLKFIGICGDLKNERLIKSINLDKLYKTMPTLSKENDFYVTKILDLKRNYKFKDN